jgi:hypothetical protein
MGMDVYGNAPKTEVGEYFRNNVWGWRPLAEYICIMFDEHTGDEPDLWFSNDGYGLDADGSLALGNALLEAIASGETEAYRLRYMADQAELPREDCTYCNTTGIRTDQVGQEMGMIDRALSPEVAALTGREFGWCNSCDGVGTRAHWQMNYPFHTENVKEFAEFLQDSGGFQIW